MAVFAWQRCAGGHGGAHLGARGRPSTGRGLGLWPLGSLVPPGRLAAVLLDSTIVRAHVSAAGAPQKKEAEPALMLYQVSI